MNLGAAHLASSRTIGEVVAARAESQPDDPALTFLLDGEDLEATWTYAELWQAVGRVAEALRRAGASGQRAVLLYEPGLEYIAAFLGTMLAGAVAVPAYPPLSKRVSERLRGVIADCKPQFVLTGSGLARVLLERVELSEGASWLVTDELPAADHSPVNCEPAALAVLQYTSGSTGTPKGVMLSHANIFANCVAVRDWLGPDPARRGSIWLPPYHDMGLLGGVLQPIFAGFPLVFMSPLHFVQRPARWLRAISKHRITLSGGPNFAYRTCALDVPEEDIQGLDLSCWREAFCGAEPVRPDTMHQFCARFAAFGFAATAINPCYGLAESTLVVSGKARGAAPTYASFDRASLESGLAITTAEAQEQAPLTGCGRVVPHTDVRIVNTQTGSEVPSGQVGEVWVSGPSVAQGYWARPEESARAFGGKLPGIDARFLRTGDLGFFEKGELFIAGRHKDLIVIDGMNHYPEDIEQTVESADASIYAGGAVAFPLEVAEREAVIIVAEVREKAQRDHGAELIRQIVEQVTARHGVAPAEVVLCRRGAIARTTSGKVRRAASRDLYLAGAFRPAAVREHQVQGSVT
jgi:acyl-CoA synthetase (AMP-forming)/AMP-acid ligase II